MALANQMAKEQEALITQQFAQTRKKLGSQKNRLQQAADDEMRRAQARMGGGMGGALLKGKGEQQAQLAEAFNQAESDIAAQELQAKAAAKEGAINRAFQSEEAQKARDLQAGQFKQTLDFQKNSFAEQMKFQWKEFDENLKTNLLNAAIALKESGMDNMGKWDAMKPMLQGLYGSRAGGVYNSQAFKDYKIEQATIRDTMRDKYYGNSWTKKRNPFFKNE